MGLAERRSGAEAVRSHHIAAAEHDAHEIEGILRAELMHDMSAVGLDHAATDPERLAGFSVGGARHDLCENLMLATCQRRGSPRREAGFPATGGEGARSVHHRVDGLANVRDEILAGPVPQWP